VPTAQSEKWHFVDVLLDGARGSSIAVAYYLGEGCHRGGGGALLLLSHGQARRTL
jgi:hypothetical protein